MKTSEGLGYPFFHILNDYEDRYAQTFMEARQIYNEMKDSGRQIWREDNECTDTLIIDSRGADVSILNIQEKY